MADKETKVVSPFYVSMVAGASAGMAVDVTLYPLDTLKTRLQAQEGFIKAGGLKGIYNGVFAAFLGSAPGAALFFTTYDYASNHFSQKYGDSAWGHMAAASLGETAACVVRVPTENVKQKQQAGIYKTFRSAISGIHQTQGLRGYYVGYLTTLTREIPFAFIQFPLWEKCKKIWAEKQGSPVLGWQSAVCGSMSGGIAAAATTPLDVCKTRLMLDMSGKYKGFVSTFQTVLQEEGWRALFSGVQPRVFWITLGGLVYFGGYEYSKRMLLKKSTDSESPL